MIHSLKHKSDLDITHEDTITSTIIGTLLHLPDDLLWKILCKACYPNDVLPKNPGALNIYEFWPKWDPTGTDNSDHVEPDVFLRFSEFDLIFEAKRSDEGGQYREQWERELISYDNEYSSSNIPVILIAIGGNGSNTENETLEINGWERPVVKCSWVRLYEAIVAEQDTLLGSGLRVVDSLIVSCNLLGIRSYRWLEARHWISKFAIEIPKDFHSLILRR